MTVSRTQHMNITVPDDSTPGPGYADNVSDSLTFIGEHDHDGINTGPLINIAAQDIEGDLSLDGYNLTNARAVRVDVQNSILTGISDLNEFYDVLGDAYFNDGYGNAIRLTEGGAVVNPTFNALTGQAVSTTFSIVSTATYNLLNVDSTGGAFTITLPISTQLSPGRFYFIQDVKGQFSTNFVTVKVSTGSGDKIYAYGLSNQTNIVLSVEDNLCFIFTDGDGHWYASNYQQFQYTNGQTVSFESSTLTLDDDSTLTSSGTAQLLGVNQINGITTFESGSTTSFAAGSTLALRTTTMSAGTFQMTGGSMTVSGSAGIGIDVSAGLVPQTANAIYGNLAGGIVGAVAGGISSTTAGGIQSGVVGGIELTGGGTDWITFNGPRTRTVWQPLVISGGYNTGWANNIVSGSLQDYGIQGPADGGSGSNVPVIACVLPSLHNGATITSMNLFFQINANTGSLPSVWYPGFLVRRNQITTNGPVVSNFHSLLSTADVSTPVRYNGNASPGSMTAYYNGGNYNIIQFVPDQYNVVDTSTYCYSMFIYTQTGGSTCIPTFYGVEINYGSINNMQFE